MKKIKSKYKRIKSKENYLHRHLAFNIYNFKKICVTCGGGKDIEVHHLNEDKLDNSRKNIRIMCKSCHRRLHMKNITWTNKMRLEASKRVKGSRNPMYGKKHTEDVKKRISEINTGKKHSKESIKKMILARTGLKRTEKQKITMSLAAKKRWELYHLKNSKNDCI